MASYSTSMFLLVNQCQLSDNVLAVVTVPVFEAKNGLHKLIDSISHDIFTLDVKSVAK